jgi:hypothetical protein
MYLRRSSQVTSIVALSVSLLLLAPGAGVAAAFNNWALVWLLGVTAGVGVALSTPYLLFRCLPASRRNYQRNVLRQKLELEEVAEIKNMQFASLFAPDRVAPGDDASFVLFLQSTHDRPSRVTLAIKSGKLQPQHRARTVEFIGGDVWCISIPVAVPPDVHDGEYALKYALTIENPNGLGSRLIRDEGLTRQRSKQRQTDILDVATDAPAAAPPTSGTWCLWGDGHPEPDLSPLDPILDAC